MFCMKSLCWNHLLLAEVFKWIRWFFYSFRVLSLFAFFPLAIGNLQGKDWCPWERCCFESQFFFVKERCSLTLLQPRDDVTAAQRWRFCSHLLRHLHVCTFSGCSWCKNICHWKFFGEEKMLAQNTRSPVDAFTFVLISTMASQGWEPLCKDWYKQQRSPFPKML